MGLGFERQVPLPDGLIFPPLELPLPGVWHALPWHKSSPSGLGLGLGLLYRIASLRAGFSKAPPTGDLLQWAGLCGARITHPDPQQTQSGSIKGHSQHPSEGQPQIYQRHVSIGLSDLTSISKGIRW